MTNNLRPLPLASLCASAGQIALTSDRDGVSAICSPGNFPSLSGVRIPDRALSEIA